MKPKYFLNSTITICFVLMTFSSFSQNITSAFIVEVAEKNFSGKIENMKDEIRFKEGKVNSRFGAANGFVAALCTMTVDSSSGTKLIYFTAESKNRRREIMKWSGTITSKIIEGMAILEDKGQMRTEYSFKGTLKED